MTHPAVSAAIAEALAEDPFYQAVSVDFAADPAQRQRVLAHYIQLAIDEGLGIGEFAVHGEDGGAIWHTGRGSAAEQAACSERRTQALKAALGPLGFDNYQRICESMAAQTPASLQDAWYLSILGVRSAARGQGIAQRLLAATLVRADAGGVSSFLETFNPKSLPFYHRQGFTREEQKIESVTGAPYWLLIRDPR